ncbi:hypothetical protein A3F65_00650 [Candidatus Saccharibacteria bacterium RIFCSPHIGHO2_12_FULL_47_16b]|nr:MAG: hypothetical protein A3F65_00650 [Candidatus Saccharibacteria bacterium RIFCSPHIGHO2_12_FULL_47_16b]
MKIYVPESYYHVYNRGVNKRSIFIDDKDYAVFLNLFKRYLTDGSLDRFKRHYINLSSEVKLLAFCLMPNHFHLLIYQNNASGMTNLLQRVLTSYSIYFNKKYRRVGPLFQDIYKASRISSDDYLQHISRYIHLNPKNWKNWEFSSLPFYLGTKQAEWLNQKPILDLFKNEEEYLEFVTDYEDYRQSLEEIESELADH